MDRTPNHRGRTVMSRNSSVSVCAALVAVAICIPAPARADDKHGARPMACADLVQLSLPDAVIRSATEVPAGPFPFRQTAVGGKNALPASPPDGGRGEHRGVAV